MTMTSARRAFISILLVLSFAFSAGIATFYLSRRALPWWSDGGNWLKHMNAILGNTYPMWEEGTYQYPPLFFILLALIYGLSGDKVLTVKIAAIGVFSIRPITTYVFVKRLFRSDMAGAGAAWMSAIAPIFVEMLGWGGYPNLLGFDLLPLAFLPVIADMEGRASNRDLMMATVMACLIPLAHHLTYAVFAGVLTSWVIIRIILKKEYRMAMTELLASTGVFLLYRLLLAWPIQFVIYNEAAYYRLRVRLNLEHVHEDMNLIMLILIAALVIPIAYRKAGEKWSRMAFLITWTLVPLCMTQGYLLGVGIDYNRILFFAFQPVLMLISWPLSYMDWPVERSRDTTGHRSGSLRGAIKRGILVLSLATLIIVNVQGLSAFKEVDLRYGHMDPYGDREKLEAITWILQNTDPCAVFVAEEPMARWIEGLAGRRVMMHLHPMYLFMTGELERERIARAILSSDLGIRNERLWVFERIPPGLGSTIIAPYKEGAYESLISINMSLSRLRTSKEILNLDGYGEAKFKWLERGEGEASYVIEYDYGQTEVLKEVRVSAGSNEVWIRWEVRILGGGEAYLEVALTPYHTSFTRLIPREGGEVMIYVGGVELIVNTTGRIKLLEDQILLIGSKDMEMCIRIETRSSAGNPVLFTYTCDELLTRYNVKYIVLPVWRTRNGEIDTRDEYRHLLKDDEMEVTFLNDKIAILGVRGH